MLEPSRPENSGKAGRYRLRRDSQIGLAERADRHCGIQLLARPGESEAERRRGKFRVMNLSTESLGN